MSITVEQAKNLLAVGREALIQFISLEQMIPWLEEFFKDKRMWIYKAIITLKFQTYHVRIR